MEKDRCRFTSAQLFTSRASVTRPPRSSPQINPQHSSGNVWMALVVMACHAGWSTIIVVLFMDVVHIIGNQFGPVGITDTLPQQGNNRREVVGGLFFEVQVKRVESPSQDL